MVQDSTIKEIIRKKENGESLTFQETVLLREAQKKQQRLDAESKTASQTENGLLDANLQANLSDNIVGDLVDKPVYDPEFEQIDSKYQQATKDTLIEMSHNVAVDSDGEAISGIASAVANTIYRNSQVRDRQRLHTGNEASGDEIYGDKATYDMLMDMAKKTDDVGAKTKIAHAIANIIIEGDEETKKLYDNNDVRQMLRDSFLRAEKSSDIGSLAFAISTDCLLVDKSKKIFSQDEEIANKMIASFSDLSYNSKGLVAGAIATMMTNEGDINEKTDQQKKITQKLATKENLAMIIDAGQKIPQQQDHQDDIKRNMASAIYKILENNPQLKEEEIGLEAKNMLLKWANEVEDKSAISVITGILARLSKSEVTKEDALFGEEDTKKTLIAMGRKTEEPNAIASVCNAIANVNWQLNQQRKWAKENGKELPPEIYGDEETHAFLMEMAAKVDNAKGEDGDNARGSVASAIAAISLGEKGGERFCNEETKNLMLNWGNKAKTDNAIIGISSAISAISLHESKAFKKQIEADRKNIFCNDPKIADAIKSMESKLEENKKDGLDHAKAENALKSAQTNSQTGEVGRWTSSVKKPSSDNYKPSAAPKESWQNSTVDASTKGRSGSITR